MNRFISVGLIIVFFLSACTPKTSITPQSQITVSVPTSTSQVQLNAEAQLYSGPGNSGYSKIAELPVGTRVSALGIFGDFVRIKTSAGAIGFVVKNALSMLPDSLKEIPVSDVSWKPLPVWIYEKANNMTMSQVGNNWKVDNNQNSEWYGITYGPFNLTDHIRLLLDFTQVNGGRLFLMGRLNTQNEWWQGIRELYIFPDGMVQIFDGTSDQAAATLYLSDFTSGEKLYIYPLDDQGRKLSIQNEAGESLLSVDFTTLAGVKMSDGFFPDKVAYVGLQTPPNSSITFNPILAETQPDGRYQENEKTLRELADERGLVLSMSSINRSKLHGPYFFNTLVNNANQYVIAGELDPVTVFGNFSKDDWQRILSDWDQISSQLNAGTLPNGFPYDWNAADEVVAFAQANKMSIRAQHLIWGPDLPDIFYQRNFSKAELEKILEFMVKARVLKYKGLISEWDIADEACARYIYGGQWTKDHFWYDYFTIEIIDQVSNWTYEMDPAAKQVFMEELIFGSKKSNDYVTLSGCYLDQLKRFKEKNLAVNYAGLEMNSWIFDPPDKDIMINFMQQVKDLGYDFSSAETTVVQSPTNYSPWPGRQKTISTVPDPLQAQANIYRDILEAYLTVNSRAFGIGGVDDGTEWFNDTGSPESDAMLFDVNFQPKPAYFAVKNLLSQ